MNLLNVLYGAGHEFRLDDKALHKGGVPVPTKMYTKQIDVSEPHHFSVTKRVLSYDPLPWNDFFDRKESIGG